MASAGTAPGTATALKAAVFTGGSPRRGVCDAPVCWFGGGRAAPSPPEDPAPGRLRPSVFELLGACFACFLVPGAPRPWSLVPVDHHQRVRPPWEPLAICLLCPSHPGWPREAEWGVLVITLLPCLPTGPGCLSQDPWRGLPSVLALPPGATVIAAHDSHQAPGSFGLGTLSVFCSLESRTVDSSCHSPGPPGTCVPGGPACSFEHVCSRRAAPQTVHHLKISPPVSKIASTLSSIF